MEDKKIPGIHNYCDRWCERCDFASRCAIYDGKGQHSSQQNDDKNKAFWSKLSENFTKAQKLLEDAAARYGVDLNSLAGEIDDIQQKEKRRWQENEAHPLSELSWQYSEASRQWLKEQPGMMEKLESLRDSLTLGADALPEVKAKMDMIRDCLAVIDWYQTLIHTKIMRALMGKSDDFAEAGDIQGDFNGSAKIAMMGIDRSIQAWIKLFEFLPAREDDFLKILAMLERMKGIVVKEFPLVHSFRRPGFDD
jgi:hypothetical protein